MKNTVALIWLALCAMAGAFLGNALNDLLTWFFFVGILGSPSIVWFSYEAYNNRADSFKFKSPSIVIALALTIAFFFWAWLTDGFLIFVLEPFFRPF